MKTKLFLLFTCCCSFFIVSHAFAQKDFIETLKGDTIRGKLRNGFVMGTGPADELKFKKLEDSKFVTIKTDTLKSYFRSADSALFVLMKMPYAEEARLVKKLENGRIELFEDYSASSGAVSATGIYSARGTISTWYARLDGGQLLEIKTNDTAISGSKREQREKNLYGLLADDQQLLDKFKKRSFSFDNIRDCIKKYNSLHRAKK
ncbi:hypothetical protein VRU48_05945 [Pedobacter sp. KR3-3]|uniref:DUF4412 domain-containing protein n=1 Tax=Pedobacter albus TaxID=3113905 RepID=A0ABU7I596_9SPHI|nr:hypothetical protein [Pedobacter sp. KR3-3]MEE1944640.1 hypothetical protein [Pedobacter sp. KR3-3]